MSHFTFQDKSEGDIERVKATLMLCYGYVALYSPPSLIISRMEATILRTISPYFVNVKVSEAVTLGPIHENLQSCYDSVLFTPTA